MSRSAEGGKTETSVESLLYLNFLTCNYAVTGYRRNRQMASALWKSNSVAPRGEEDPVTVTPDIFP